METNIEREHLSTDNGDQNAKAEKRMETQPIEVLKYAIPQNEIAEALFVSTAYVSQLVKSLNVKTIKHRKWSYLGNAAVRQVFEAKGVVYPLSKGSGVVIAFQMLKGGVGKTTKAVNLARRLSHYGAKVLVIDMDAQGNLSATITDEDTSQRVFADVIERTIDIEDAIITVSPGLDVLTSNFDNTGLDAIINKGQKNLATYFANEISDLKSKYDYILIDCNPSLSAINASIALAADKIIVPLNPDRYCDDGLQKVLDAYEELESNFDKKLNYGFLLSKFDLRTTVGQEYLLKYKNQLQDKIYKTVIRDSKDVSTTLFKDQTLFMLKDSVLKEDFDRLTREIMGLQLDSPASRN